MNTVMQAPVSECTCLNRYDHCASCQETEARVKAEGRKKPRRPRARKAAPSAAAAAAINPDAVLVTAEAVALMLSVGVRTLWRMAQQDGFPQPIRFTRKLVRWNRAAVLAWAERAAGGGASAG